MRPNILEAAATPHDAIRRVTEGLLWEDAGYVAQKLGVALEQFAVLAGIPRSTFFRRRGSRFPVAESEHIMRYARLWHVASDVLPNGAPALVSAFPRRRLGLSSFRSMARGLTYAAGLIAGLVASATCAWAQTDLGHLKFVGSLVSAGKEHVILIDATSGRSSGWIQVGQSFGDAVVTQYNAATETVVVSCRGATRTIPLVEAKTVAAGETLQIGTKSYTVFSDSRHRRAGGIVFRGNVTVIGDGLRASADEARFGAGTLSFEGNVRFERAGALLTGNRAVLHPDAQAIVMSGAKLHLSSVPPPAHPGPASPR